MDLMPIRLKHIMLMGKTVMTLGNIIRTANPDHLTTLTDGAEGWTAGEVLCHIRDFDVIFRQRAEQMVSEYHPTLTAYDHLVLAAERDYRSQNPFEVYNQLVESRREFIEFFTALTPNQWEAAGIHPERGFFTMTDAVIQVGHHDADHIEQITRILTQA